MDPYFKLPWCTVTNRPCTVHVHSMVCMCYVLLAGYGVSYISPSSQSSGISHTTDTSGLALLSLKELWPWRVLYETAVQDCEDKIGSGDKAKVNHDGGWSTEVIQMPVTNTSTNKFQNATVVCQDIWWYLLAWSECRKCQCKWTWTSRGIKDCLINWL